MFETPSAKRIKRSELFDNANSEDEDNTRNTTDEALNHSFEYEFINQAESKSSRPQPQAQPAAEEEVFAFNLFKPASKPTNASTVTEPGAQQNSLDEPPRRNLISIRSPSPPPHGTPTNGFSCERPESAYFTSALPEAVQRKQRDDYASSAISASKVLALARLPWPGASLAWRVISLPTHGRQVVVHRTRVADVSEDRSKNGGGGRRSDLIRAEETKRRRPRPSKKRRVLLMARARHRQMLVDETKTKEAHEREKKNQKNRERKMKRRAKERREKAEKAGADGKESEVDV